MGGTLIMVVTLAMVLGLILFLLAQLYCSLLCRRRKLQKPNHFNTTTSFIAATATNNDTASFYAPGVLQAPRNFLYPAVSNTQNIDLEKQYSSSHSPTRFTTIDSPRIVQESAQLDHHCNTTSGYNDMEWSSSYKEQFIYICNPIYDNEVNRASMSDTPFETPVASPSRLDTGDSSGEDDEDQLTPPLTPMKKLPAEACSVSLRDPRSLSTSGSENSNTNKDGVSLSSSASPCTSPSW